MSPEERSQMQQGMGRKEINMVANQKNINHINKTITTIIVTLKTTKKTSDKIT